MLSVLKFLRQYILSHVGKIVRVLFLILISLGLFLSAAVLAVRNWVLPDIEKYHPEIVTLASRAFGLPVQIGKIEADWNGLRPHLLFTDVRLLDAQGKVVLKLGRIDNTVAWTTLLAMELRLYKLEIDKPDLQIRRDTNGVLYVAGLKISGQSEDDKLSDWLLHQSHIIVRNGRVTWQDELGNKSPLIFNQVQFKLDNSRRHHRFMASVLPPSALSASVEIAGDLVGASFADWSKWRGEVTAQVTRADVAAWQEWTALPEVLSQAQGSVQAVFALEAGKLHHVVADLNLSNVQSRLAAELPPLALSTLAGRVAWQKLEHGFEVSTKKLSWQMTDGLQLPATDFRLRLTGDTRLAEGELELNTIELEKLPLIAKYLPLPDVAKQKLADYSPLGRVNALHAQWHREAEQAPHFELTANFNNLSVNRVGDFPGVSGLTGELSGSESSGELSLNSHDLRFDAPEILLRPVTFNTFKVQASWQRKQAAWDVKFNNLSLANDDLAGSAYGHYQLSDSGQGTADVTANFTRAAVSQVVKYLPKKLLGDATMGWLQTGLVAGHAEDVFFHLRGDLQDFPFPENKRGTFQVKAKASGLVVDYAQGWPRVENAVANLLIEGPRLQIDASAATVAGASAQKVSVTIADLMSAEPMLQVLGEAKGDTQHGLNFIKHSPVREYISGFTDDAVAKGEGKLTLQLDIPLSDRATLVKGRYEFFDNEIQLRETIPLAHKVSGELRFSESSLQTNNISAQMLGGPANLAIQTEADGMLKIKLKGKANIDVWRKANPHPFLPLLHGSTNWTADASLLKNQFSLSVGSNLQGLSSELPFPFSKKANESNAVKFDLKQDATDQTQIQLQYGDLLNLYLLQLAEGKGQSTIKQGYINFGPSKRLPERDGLWLTGVLSQLPLENWLDILKRLPPSQEAWPEIEGIDLTVQKLVGFATTVNALNVHARNHKGVLTTQVSSKEVNGELSWFPQGKGKLVVRLRNATLVDRDTNKEVAVVSKSRAKVVSKSAANLSMPTLDVAIEQFSYRGNPLGRLELHASQFEKDILLNSLRLTNPDGTLQMNGKWGAAPAQTHIAAKLTISDIGKVLGRSGYPNMVKNGSGTLDCDLVWAGSPDQFVPKSLDGYLNLNLAKGEFSKLDTVGGKGFEFKNINGIAKIRQGVLTTDNLKVSGSLANVSLAGQVDMSRETQNLRASVSPNISNGVSLLAFAGGPAVGAVVFIANKILRDPLDKLAAFEYNVTGTWADPKIDKVGAAQTTPR
jgi:uncharacterized protein (TIGR02099 family)